MFDKTGTITKEGMELSSALVVQNGMNALPNEKIPTNTLHLHDVMMPMNGTGALQNMNGAQTLEAIQRINGIPPESTNSCTKFILLAVRKQFSRIRKVFFLVFFCVLKIFFCLLFSQRFSCMDVRFSEPTVPILLRSTSFLRGSTSVIQGYRSAQK